jgi:hypothetical protein
LAEAQDEYHLTLVDASIEASNPLRIISITTSPRHFNMTRGPPRSSGSSSSSRSGSSGEYKELRLPNSRSVKALIYFCGRDPRKAKSVRRYYADDDFDAHSMGSGGSIFSRSSATSQVYLVESTDPYYYWDTSVSHSSSSRKHKSSKARYNTTTPQNQPAGAWARRHATVEDDDDDDDDSGSELSADDYGGPNPGGPFPPHPGMMPGGMPYPPQGPPQGPPPGAFQPVYGPGPGMPTFPQHGTPRPPPPNGFPMPPPPPPGSAMPRGGMPPPPPPPPGGHFVRGRGGIQVFEQ